jgi:uncharacterized protein YggE
MTQMSAANILRQIAVKGIGKVSAPPDLVVISMTLDITETEYDKTVEQSGRMLEVLRTAITTAGHDAKDLKTTKFNINTKYESYHDKNNDWKQKFVGYTASHGLRLEFDLNMDKLRATLAAVAGCEAAPDFTIQLSVKDPDAISEQLLKSAVENATRKARVLAETSGVNLGDILRIDYNWSELHLYSESDIAYPLMEMKSIAVESSMAFEPEDIDVNDSVTVVWAIA